MRSVGQEGGVPDKERFLFPSRVIDKIRDRLHGDAADGQAFIAVTTTALGVAVGHPVSEAAVLPGALPPLAGLVRQVAVGGQQPDKAGMLMKGLAQRFVEFMPLGTRVAVLLHASPTHIITCDAMLERKEPSDHGSEGRAANWRRHVTAFKDQALGCELVEMWGLDLGVPHEAIVRPCLIIRQNKYDIGLRRVGLCCHTACRKQNEDQDSFHLSHFSFDTVRSVGCTRLASWDWVGFSNRLAFPVGNAVLVSQNANPTARNCRFVDLGQPLAHGFEYAFVLWGGGKVVMLVEVFL